MPTECSAELFGFGRVEGRAVVAGFDGGKITSDAGGVRWGGERRVVATAEWTGGEANPRFVVTSLGECQEFRARRGGLTG